MLHLITLSNKNTGLNETKDKANLIGAERVNITQLLKIKIGIVLSAGNHY